MNKTNQEETSVIPHLKETFNTMFEKRNHLTDPMILVSCPFCGRDLYPFKNIDRFEFVLETIEDLKRSFIKIKCLNCKSIFRERTSRHKAWLNHYRQDIIEQFEKQKSKMDRKISLGFKQEKEALEDCT